MSTPTKRRAVMLGAALLMGAACQPAVEDTASVASAALKKPAAPAVCLASSDTVDLPGGAFTLGAQPERPEEGPPREVTVSAFSIDRTEVTNIQFSEFVKATGYVTLAERAPDPALYPGVPADQLKPAGLVFVGADQVGDGNPADWWSIVDGANWRQPEGPGSTLQGREHNPVVQVGYEDALAYAKWRGRDLPTEAEWEYAARADIESARFEWGNAPLSSDKPQANTWQGLFPASDTGEDGYPARTAPVGCYPPNGFGLHDMSGNVWEWTSDRFGDDAAPPLQQHLIKGGSFLCADNYCLRYRPSARQGGPVDTGSSHIGFRTVKRHAA